MKDKHLSCIYLPQYAPELAPVELFFGNIKRLISTKRGDKLINFNQDTGRKVLTEVIESIEWISIMKLWRHFMSELRQMTGEIDSILKLKI